MVPQLVRRWRRYADTHDLAARNFDVIQERSDAAIHRASAHAYRECAEELTEAQKLAALFPVTEQP